MNSPRIFVSFLLAFSALSLSAEDWPQFLGPRANGISSETGLIDEFPESGPPQVWSMRVGTGYTAPSIRGNRLVLHHRIGQEEVVACMEAATGKPMWEYAYTTTYEDPYGYNNGPRCTPLLTTNRCYTFGAEGKLLCLDLFTGKKIWERDTGREWKVPQPFFGVGSTPILEDGRLIVMVGGQPDSGMVAFHAETGRTIWESVGSKNWTGQPMIGWPGERNVVWNVNEKQASYATPVAATIHGKRHVFCLMRQGLVSVDPKNGEVNFSRWFRSQANDSVNAANPVVVGDTVFFSGAYYRVGSVLIRVKPDGKSFEEVWRTPPDPSKPGASIADRDPTVEIHWTTPIYHDGYLYAFSGRNEPDATFRCIELKTGKVMWERDERWGKGYKGVKAPDVYGRGSAIMADGKLIVLGEVGLLGLFNVNPKKAEELDWWQVPKMEYPCWAAPVLANKKLYLRSESHLVCLDVAKK